MGASPANDRITVILADDHGLVRAGLRALLENMPRISLLAEVTDGRGLLAALATEPRADVVVTDLSMPGMDGLEAVTVIRDLYPRVRVVVLTMQDDPGTVKEAVARGAHAYVVKDAAPFELEQALHAVADGSTYFSSTATRSLLRGPEPAATEVLTQRQREVLSLLARGYSSKRVGRELGLSAKTIDVHRSRIMERLKIHELAGLTRYAIRMHLVQP